MTLKLLISSMLFFTAITFGQSKLILSPNIRLLKDSLVNNQLIQSLNGFLLQETKPNRENTFVLKEHLLETSVLLDEIKDSEASGKFKNKKFYRPYLTNIASTSDTAWYLQLSYIGITDSMPVLRESFNLLALKRKNDFYFASPFINDHSLWKTRKIENYTFKFRNTFNAPKAKNYVNTVIFFDKKLNAKSKTTTLYCCDNFSEALQLIGITYKSDYNGMPFNTVSCTENDRSLIFNGTFIANSFGFDPHDLWHARLRQAISSDSINKPVDEGCAYLYGGSWGLSWQTILTLFRNKVASDPQADWLALYNEPKNFEDKGQEHLIVGYVINALLIQKIEKEKGFSAAMPLIKCGKYEKGNENYFKALEKITGISRSGFNAAVWKLVRS